MHAPGGVIALPKVVFSVVQELESKVSDTTAQLHGFNGEDDFDLGERYLRWMQPEESFTASRLEYDMDEEDKAWMDTINADRVVDGLNTVSYEFFEVVIDKLEKDWFDLVKRMPKREVMPFEDSKCAICDDGECENSNAIVFCDGCNLAVHQDCYGVPYIPEGQWLCRKCTVSPDKPVSCVLCPNSYGAFKQTTTAKWAHLICAIWIPDTGVSNTVYMEPIDGVENIPKVRWNLVCYLCQKRTGACIQCAKSSCYAAFHVTCARERGLGLKMKAGGANGELKAFCERHIIDFTPLAGAHLNSQRIDKTRPTLLGNRTMMKQQRSNKAARAYKKSYSSGPPIIPGFIFNRLIAYVGKFYIDKLPEFVAYVCRYWSLKREARRGAPLLKRLHLEPWTASASSKHQNEVDKAKKVGLMRLLRSDLEQVRKVTNLVHQREQMKLDRVQIVKKIIDDCVFAKDKLLRDALSQIALLDNSAIFAMPVSLLQAPDYYDVIKHPMDWATMAAKVDRHEYLTGTDFQDDIELVLNNARRYNKVDSIVHKEAIRVGELAEPILAHLEKHDRQDSHISKHAAELSALLTTEFVDSLFAYHFEAPVVELVAAKEAIEVSKSAAKGRAAKAPKRTTAQAGLPERREETSRARRSAVPIVEQETELAEPESIVEKEEPAGEDGGMDLDAKIEIVEKVTNRTPSRKNQTKRQSPMKQGSPIESAQSEAQNESIADAVAEVNGSASEVSQGSTSQAMDLASLDARSSFKLFESGWVLPAGTSRRSAAAVTTTVPAIADDTASTSINADLPVPALSRRPPSRKGKEKAIPVVETVDDDEIEEEESIVIEDGDIDITMEAESAIGNPATPKGKRRGVLGPDGKTFREGKQVWMNRLKELQPKVTVTDRQKMEDGLLLWARIPSYPFWPCEVADPAASGTPKNLLALKPQQDKTAVLVMFFDELRRASWVPRKDLRRLGEVSEVDQLLQSPYACPKTKTYKGGQGQADQLVESFDWAISSIMTPEEEKAESRKSGKKGSEKK